MPEQDVRYNFQSLFALLLWDRVSSVNQKVIFLDFWNLFSFFPPHLHGCQGFGLMSLMFAEQMFLPTEPFPSSLAFLLKIKDNCVYVYMHVCGDSCGDQVCQISLELHLQAVVNCPVWSGRRASTLTEPPFQASPPTFKAEGCLGLKDAEARLTGVLGTTAFFSFWLGGAVPSMLLLLSTTAGVYPVGQNPRSATNFQSNLADALRCPGSHFWNRCVCSWCRATEKNPDAPYEWKPRAQLTNTREACSFKYSRKLADIPRTMARNISDVMAWVTARTHSWMSHMQIKWTAPHTSVWSVCHASMSLSGY